GSEVREFPGRARGHHARGDRGAQERRLARGQRDHRSRRGASLSGALTTLRQRLRRDARAMALATAGTTTMNNVEAVRHTLYEALKADPKTLIMGEDVGARGNVFLITKGFLEEFGPERIIDTPLAEASIVGVAVGMAMEGLRPIAEIQFADFIYPAFNQIVGEAAKTRYRSNGDYTCPMVIRTP